jgi:lipoprotein-anchoring transpeptidase ErfK/SrfK
VRAREHQLHWLIAALTAGVLLVELGLAQSARAGLVPDLSDSVQLSNERTFTRWAFAAQILPIREWPEPSARKVASISLTTEDGLPEVYVLLRSWTDVTGQDWLQVRLPVGPEALTGWVETSAFDRTHLARTQLVVDRRHLRATLYRAGRKVFRSRIGVGKATTPTPAGRFWIRELIRSPDPGGPYGPWAFGTSAYSRLSDWPGGGVIGIHGTNQPVLIPGRPSHGCIRMPNPAIRRLARLMPIGTPVWIR